MGTPSHLGHMDRVAATMPSQAHAGAAQEAPNIGQWEGQDVPLVRPSSCTVKGGIPSSRRYLPTYLKKDPPLHSSYMVAEDSKTLPLQSLLIPSDHRVLAGLSTVRSLPAPPPTLHSQHRHVGRRRTVHLSALIMVIGIGLGFIPVLTVV